MHGLPGVFSVVLCAVCGSGATRPLASTDEAASWYPSEYGPYSAPAEGVIGVISRAIRWRQNSRALSRAPLATLAAEQPGTLVDVGCGRGDLAASFVSLGWKAVGIEPSEAACLIARSRGVEARQGTLTDVALETSSYSAALFHHSLEHTVDPGGDLKAVSAALRPGGLAVVTVPNFDSWQRRHFGDRWYHLDLPRHRTHFTVSGLRRTLEQAGLRVESVTTSTSTVGLAATVQYALFGRCLFPGGLSLRVAAGLCVVVLPVARVLDRLAGGGDQIHAVARRAA